MQSLFRNYWCRSLYTRSTCQAYKSIHTTPIHKTLWPFIKHVDFDAYDYAEQLSEPEPPELKQIRLDALANNQPEALKMISPLQGGYMASLVRAQQAKVVLELGCYIGYSALWLAHGFRYKNCATDAHLWTCEHNPCVAQMAQKNIQTAGYQDTVTVMNQSADSVLETWDANKKIDLIFIDANKSAYKSYYDAIIDRNLLQDKGQIVVDNVLFRGLVYEQSNVHKSTYTKNPADIAKPKYVKKTPLAQKIGQFNRHVANDPRTTQVILPIFDGVMIIQLA